MAICRSSSSNIRSISGGRFSASFTLVLIGLSLSLYAYGDQAVIVGSFSDSENARAATERLNVQLSNKNLPLRSIVIDPLTASNFRVGLVTENDQPVRRFLPIIRELGYEQAWVLKYGPEASKSPLISSSAPSDVTEEIRLQSQSPPAALTSNAEDGPDSKAIAEVEVEKVISPRRKKSDEEWVPPGFEDLSATSINEIDFFYGGFYLTSALASFNQELVTIIDPSVLVEKVTDIKNPEYVSDLLSKPLYANAALVCKSRNSVECGKIDPVDVEIIFDFRRLRADIFIASELLSVRSLDQLKFLPASDAGFSVLDDFSVNFSGSSLDDAEWTYNVSNNTTVSYAENRLLIRSNQTSDDFEIDRFVFQREFMGKDLRVGVMRENAGNFRLMGDELFQGVALQSSLTTRKDLSFALGSELDLFLDSRSRVELYKDGRLISSDYYDIGNQILDTSDLPQGSYNIEIKIVNDANETRTESRFYSKTSQLPPADQSIYFFQAGEKLKESEGAILPAGTGDSFARAGISRRLAATFGGYAGLSIEDDNQMIETGFFKQGQAYELQAFFGYDSYKVAALDVTFRYRFEHGSFRLQTRKIFDQDLAEDEISQIGQANFQRNLSYSLSSSLGKFDFFYRHQESNEQGKENFGLKFSPPTVNWLPGLSLKAELSKNEGDTLLLFNAKYRLRQGNWSQDVTAKWDKTRAADTNDAVNRQGRYGLAWSNGRTSGNQYSAGFSADYNDRRTYEANLRANTSLGSAELRAKYNDESNAVFYNGSMKTNFGFTAKNFGVGGKNRSAAGFLVRANSAAPTEAAIDVRVDDQSVATIGVNKSVMIPVSPYDTHTLELVGSGDELTQIQGKKIERTFYPGNVISVEYDIAQVYIAIARVMDEEGRPITNALVKNAASIAITDDTGFMQAELIMGAKKIELSKSGKLCAVRLDDVEIANRVAFLGEITCL